MIYSKALEKSTIQVPILESTKHADYKQSGSSCLLDAAPKTNRIYSDIQQSRRKLAFLYRVYIWLAHCLFYIPLIVLSLIGLTLWCMMFSNPYCWSPFNPFGFCALLHCVITFVLCIIFTRKTRSIDDKSINLELLYPGILVIVYMVTISAFILNCKDFTEPYSNHCSATNMNTSFKDNLTNISHFRHAISETHSHVSIDTSSRPNLQNNLTSITLLTSNGPTLPRKIKETMMLVRILIATCFICMALSLIFSVFAFCVTMSTHWRSHPSILKIYKSVNRWFSKCHNSACVKILACILWVLEAFAWPLVICQYSYDEVFPSNDPHVQMA